MSKFSFRQNKHGLIQGPAIIANDGRIAVDCQCGCRAFEAHVRIERAGARISELVCCRCGATKPVELGFIPGKLTDHSKPKLQPERNAA